MKLASAAAVLLVLVSGPAVSPATASRAELDGRGLPRLLGLDPSLVRTLPASAGPLEPQGLVDYYTSDAFVLALGGRTIRYAYFLDGETHNLLLAHPSGWGVTLGYSETYQEFESHDLFTTTNGSQERFNKTENERRELRLGLGWRHSAASGRVLEAGLGASYLDWDNATHSLTITDQGPENREEGGWDSDRALGFDATLRSVSPEPGLQVAVYLSYADLKPKTDTDFPVNVLRRRASVDLGWRLRTPHTDDLVLGFTSSWQTDTKLTINVDSPYESDSREEETKEGSLGFFLSGEREILTDLRIRGGVRGLITFRDSELERNVVDTSYRSYLKTSNFTASIDSPDFYLGAGYRWKRFDFEGRLRESINLDAPVLRWSVGMAF